MNTLERMIAHKERLLQEIEQIDAARQTKARARRVEDSTDEYI